MIVGIASLSLFAEGAGVRPVAAGAVVKGAVVKEAVVKEAKVSKVPNKVALSVVQEIMLFVRARTVRGAIKSRGSFRDRSVFIHAIK